MSLLFAFILAELTAELALFAAAGYLLFAIDDLAVDAIYLLLRGWRPRFDAAGLGSRRCTGWMAVFIPAWDEAVVIAPMLRAALARFDHPDYRLFIGYYRNDPATEAAIRSVADNRIMPVRVDADGPTTKAHCLNRLYVELESHEQQTKVPAKAIVLHDAEDVVHPLELRLFDNLVEHAGLIQLPVIPLPNPESRWVAGHYADEFAEAHGKELIVREAIGASIPLAGVGCAIERVALSRIAARHDGRPFSGASMTEDYEMGLRLGAIGERTMFVRIPDPLNNRWVIGTRGHFPTTVAAAARQKTRWIGGIALAGWDQLGWRGGLAERWMRMRDRRAPLAALLLVCGYSAAFLWAQVAFAEALGAPISVPVSPGLRWLMQVNALLLGWRLMVRAAFTTVSYGWREGLRSLPRAVVGNLIAMLAAQRALLIHSAGGARRWEKTDHIFPSELSTQ